jgi:hypothetical protein
LVIEGVLSQQLGINLVKASSLKTKRIVHNQRVALKLTMPTGIDQVRREIGFLTFDQFFVLDGETTRLLTPAGIPQMEIELFSDGATQFAQNPDVVQFLSEIEKRFSGHSVELPKYRHGGLLPTGQ